MLGAFDSSTRAYTLMNFYIHSYNYLVWYSKWSLFSLSGQLHPWGTQHKKFFFRQEIVEFFVCARVSVCACFCVCVSLCTFYFNFPGLTLLRQIKRTKKHILINLYHLIQLFLIWSGSLCLKLLNLVLIMTSALMPD